MKLKRIPASLIILAMCVSFLYAPALAAEPIEKTLTLTEDWRLTDNLDLEVPEGTTLIIDGQGKYYIYEMGGELLNSVEGGMVYLKNTLVYAQGDEPVADSLAELSKAARNVTAIDPPAKDDTFLALPDSTGYDVAVAYSSKPGVISTEGTITPPSRATAVTLRLVLTDSSGNLADTGAIVVNVPAKTPPPSDGGGTATAPAPEPVTEGNITSVTKEIKPTTAGTTASAALTQSDMTALINAVTAAAAANNTTANVNITVAAAGNATHVGTTLPAASLRELADAQASSSLTVTTPIGSVTFDGNALESIGAAANTSVTISIAEVAKESLNATQQALVGDRPVIDLSVTSGSEQISDFGGGSASVSIPYALAEGENPDNLVVWFLADDGTLTPIEGSYRNGSLTFVTDHFSQYVLAYFPFDDLNGEDWFYENVAYAYANGLMSGVGNDLFNPSGSTTRGMVATILWRFEGKPASGAGSFTDVAAGQWYADAVNWAAAKGIVEGDDGKFAPNAAITREQMAAIVYRYAVYKGYDTSKLSDLSSFADAAQVSDWAGTAMKWVVQAGIIGGSDNKLDPSGSAQRAQVAAIFQRFIENISK